MTQLVRFSSVWSARIRDAYDELGGREVDVSRFAFVADFLASFDEHFGGAPDFELLATCDQSCWLHDGRAVFFDVYQSAAIKSLLGGLTGGYPTFSHQVKRCLALALSHDEPGMSRAILDQASDNPAHHYRHHESTLEDGTRVLGALMRSIGREELFLVVDQFLLAHELFHFLVKAGDPIATRNQQVVSTQFDDIVGAVCYFRAPDFGDRLRRQTNASLSEQAVENERQRQQRQEASYQRNRHSLVEEIACDWFAFNTISSSFGLTFFSKHDPLEVYSRFLQIAFLVMSVINLHQAMLKRALLVASGAPSSEAPDDLSDMHLRLTSMIFVAATCHPISKQLGDSDEGEQLHGELLAQCNLLIGPLKTAFDACVLFPTTNSVAECLRGIVDRRGATSDAVRASVEPEEVFDRAVLEAVFRQSGDEGRS